MSKVLSHKIFNLESGNVEFELQGYIFKRIKDYDKNIKGLYRCSQISPYKGKWIQTRKEQLGQHVHTFDAFWNGEGPEPIAKIWKGFSLIYDICLLWSLYGGTYVFTGERALRKSPYFYVPWKIKFENELCNLVDTSLSTVLNNKHAEELCLSPGLFLLQESYKTSIIDHQILFISPLIDLLSSKVKFESNWTNEEMEKIINVKNELLKTLKLNIGEDSISENIFKPFIAKICSMEKPTATDKLICFLKQTPAMKNIKISAQVIEAQAKVFNKLRNATIHYAGVPTKPLDIIFEKIPNRRIKANTHPEDMNLAMVYYTKVFSDLIALHFFRILGCSSPNYEADIERTLLEFFRRGIYNFSDWLNGPFRDNVVLLSE